MPLPSQAQEHLLQFTKHFMTTYNIAINDPNQAVEILTRQSIDDQLAVLWYVYTQMGNKVTPAAPGAASPEIAGGLFEQVKAKSFEEQLRIQRDLAKKADTQISREYSALSADTKLAFWYYLARGMDEGTIVPMPEEYYLAKESRDVLAAIEVMDFEQQITVLRQTVVGMGAQPAAGAAI